MASIEELDKSWPAKYTLSNQKLIIMARVREDLVYFFDELGPTTTIILLAEPDCYDLKYIFLEFMIAIGATVIDLREKETFDVNYKLSKKTTDIIRSILTNNKYDKIITHPKYPKENDSQNRALYDYVSTLLKNLGIKNHYTYNKIGEYGKPDIPIEGSLRNSMLLLYSKAAAQDDMKSAKKYYENYLNISSKISGLRRIY